MFLTFVLLLGCEPAIKSGKIVDKPHRAAYSESVPVHMSDIEIGDTKIPIYTNQTVYHPEYFAITIENEDKNGRVVRRTVTVSEEVYKKNKLDDWIEFFD